MKRNMKRKWKRRDDDETNMNNEKTIRAVEEVEHRG